MPTMANDTVSRTQVSLRLPAEVANSIEIYAKQNRIPKTAAYEHFLRLGLSGNKAGSSQSDIGKANAKLDKILAMLSNNSNTEACSGKEDVIETISEAALQFPAIKRAYLFGSFSRNTFTDESDIDIRIEIDRSAGFNLHDLSQFNKQIERRTGRSVDTVSASVIKNKQLKEAIERDKELIYERKE